MTRTAKWLALRQVKSHYHARLNDDEAIARIARLVTGRGVGLVVSGGGARGFAHLGGVKALREAGIPIDKIGGTSMGSIIAGMVAMGWDYQTMLQQALAFDYTMDYTFPAVSFVAGAVLTEELRSRYGADVQIEDLPLSFFCVTTDLCTSSLKMHTSGPLWRYVRASASIPGLYPPMIDGESFLVDGGLVNNMPVDLMQECDDIGHVIAFDVSEVSEPETGLAIDGALSGWKILRQRLNPFTGSVTVPGIGQTLMRASLTKSTESTIMSRALADLYIQFSVEHYGMLDFKVIEEIAQSGYQSVRKYIASNAECEMLKALLSINNKVKSEE